jgi:hypothetical protein
MAHRLDWLTEILTVLLIDDRLTADSQAHHAYCTIEWMTDPLQTGLATGSETISHTGFDSVYI